MLPHKIPQTEWLNQRNFTFSQFRRWKSQLKVWTGWIPGQASAAAFLPRPHVACLCAFSWVSLSFITKTYWKDPMLMTSFDLNYLLKSLYLNTVRLVYPWAFPNRNLKGTQVSPQQQPAHNTNIPVFNLFPQKCNFIEYVICLPSNFRRVFNKYFAMESRDCPLSRFFNDCS